jgi:two-component system chemotaxis response regulator CheV
MAKDKKGILLETGTNEFEIVEFTVGPTHYGINVAKVREVIKHVPVTLMPNSHPYVDGVFTLRGRVMPLVNLPRVLGATSQTSDPKIIVSELNNYFVGFLVDEVSRIHRISWTELETPPNISESEMVIGIIKMVDKMVILLDFERIISDINPEINKKMTNVPQSATDLKPLRKEKAILIAEDSKMLRELLVNTLHSSGYENVAYAENGKVAWDQLIAIAEADDNPIENKLQLVITDIEMPQMDGHHLTNLIKQHPKLNKLPVIIFSSLINEEMRRKGESIGATAQVSKPEIGQLIDLIDKHIL